MMFAVLLLAENRVPENLSMFDPVSPPAESIKSLSFLMLAITGAIFVIVEAILIYAIYRFRHGPPKGTGEPAQVYGSTPIEIAWTAAPALIVFVMMLVIARTLWEVKVDPNKPPKDSQPVRVTVIGHQWWWEYRYENISGEKCGFIAANELHVPASNFSIASERRPVYLSLQSAVVCHSYWVPRLAGKTDLIPGRTNHMWFETGMTGLYLGQCAEFCGTQHAKMLLRVYVDTPDDFARWVENQKKDAVADPAVKEGRNLFLSQSCASCHQIRGTSAVGTYAPDLTHLMSRQTIASGIVPNTRENLRAWLIDPEKMKPGCRMPAFGLSEEKLDLILNYLETLR
ncbi:MAG: cytochrome c oxidase subunit II [Planctomycetes bacterium]|nr:cytochrome c oxidase subunit II [Planctomycetota bacterium]